MITVSKNNSKQAETIVHVCLIYYQASYRLTCQLSNQRAIHAH